MIECVPNISEGRHRPTIEAIARRIADAPGVRLLEVDPDHDTNRSVLTFVGEPEAVLEGARRCIEAAAEHIDLGHHQGSHPRFGAADVVPFVPFPEGDLELCRGLAERLAAISQVGGWFYNPPLLHEIRRGEFEGLVGRTPDFGALHPTAGAVAIGAREVLIAYNVDLATDDVGVARRIARRVRELGDRPGLPGVRALGWRSPSRTGTQVTTNLVDWPKTPPHRLLAEVRRHAESLGVEVAGAELVGMIPRAAVLAAGPTLDRGLAALALPPSAHAKILEISLEAP